MNDKSERLVDDGIMRLWRRVQRWFRRWQCRRHGHTDLERWKVSMPRWNRHKKKPSQRFVHKCGRCGVRVDRDGNTRR